MKRIERSALVAFSAQQMFDLINDIGAYPQFMPGCVGAEILKSEETSLTAWLDLSSAGFKHSFVTRNQLEPPVSMRMSLVEGPFSMLEGQWTFQSLDDNACKVGLWLEFELSNTLLNLAASKLFEKIASEQVDAICRRAKQVYK